MLEKKQILTANLCLKGATETTYPLLVYFISPGTLAPSCSLQGPKGSQCLWAACPSLNGRGGTWAVFQGSRDRHAGHFRPLSIALSGNSGMWAVVLREKAGEETDNHDWACRATNIPGWLSTANLTSSLVFEEYEFLFLSEKPNQPLLGHGVCDTPERLFQSTVMIEVKHTL